jgi:hypothetical protein
VFLNECRLLEHNGNEVMSFERFSDDIDDSTMTAKIQVALACAWSHEVYDELSKLLAKVRPDVAHFHNTFPLISPSAYAACRDNGVPVVQTLHNFRFITGIATSMLQRVIASNRSLGLDAAAEPLEWSLSVIGESVCSADRVFR